VCGRLIIVIVIAVIFHEAFDPLKKKVLIIIPIISYLDCIMDHRSLFSE